VQQRNSICECGSGKKFKQCCAAKPEKQSTWWLYGFGGLVLLGAIWGLSSSIQEYRNPAEPSAPAGKVWSAEHGHYHDAPLDGGASDAQQTPQPGQVWSEEHGHYHDATAEDSGVSDN